MPFQPQTPYLTADIIIELQDRDDHPIVLIERRNPPAGWALPGGFVDRGETVEQAAIREAREETCLKVTLQTLLGCYSDPARDTRMHTASIVYIAHASGRPRAADDARQLALFDPANIQVTLAFDHHTILQDYLRFRETGELPGPGGHLP
jgi:8-oxo-dGTP diphosphatase